MEKVNFSAHSAVQTVSIAQLMTPQFVGGKIALPVAHYSPFTSFEHVEGVPTKDGSSFSISKLQILNSLIDQLVRLKDKRALQDLPDPSVGLSENALDAFIDEVAKKLQASVSSVPAGTSSAMGIDFGMATSQTGAVVSVLA